MGSRILFLFVLAVASIQAKPGKEAILDQKDYTTTLYLGGVLIEENGNVGVQFLLIPPSIEKDCQGKTWRACRKLRPKSRKSRPTRVLDHWVYGKAAKAIPLAVKTIEEAEGGKSFAIDATRSIRAKIHWELWTNGENFKILKVK